MRDVTFRLICFCLFIQLMTSCLPCLVLAWAKSPTIFAFWKQSFAVQSTLAFTLVGCSGCNPPASVFPKCWDYKQAPKPPALWKGILGRVSPHTPNPRDPLKCGLTTHNYLLQSADDPPCDWFPAFFVVRLCLCPTDQVHLFSKHTTSIPSASTTLFQCHFPTTTQALWASPT